MSDSVMSFNSTAFNFASISLIALISVAFFPVYPAVTKGFNTVTGVEPGLAAMIVSNLAFLGALVYLQKLCLREYGERVAGRAVFYMAIFPTAFFSFAPYSEPLFIMLTIASLYYMRSERWWMAGAFGGFAGRWSRGLLRLGELAVELLAELAQLLR